MPGDNVVANNEGTRERTAVARLVEEQGTWGSCSMASNKAKNRPNSRGKKGVMEKTLEK
ncbi:MAG TPA: hypothetical protein VK149_03625 [Sideroxyarcus sp.]|nr:hypothetical protein [Sideroxyarcus sp.]